MHLVHFHCLFLNSQNRILRTVPCRFFQEEHVFSVFFCRNPTKNVRKTRKKRPFPMKRRPCHVSQDTISGKTSQCSKRSIYFLSFVRMKDSDYSLNSIFNKLYSHYLCILHTVLFLFCALLCLHQFDNINNIIFTRFHLQGVHHEQRLQKNQTLLSD